MKTPRARILAIGDELLLGRTVDTNSTHIARWLGDHGFTVDGVRTVADGENAIIDALHWAAKVDLVICTGGLGPTDDDRTRQALASALGVPLTFRTAAWAAITAWYARVRPGKPIPTTNRRQAELPRGAQILANDRGTAPGMLTRLGKAWVACMPGVPHEMHAMLDGVGRRLPRLYPGLTVPEVEEVWFAGLGESDAQERIGDLLTEHDPRVGITVSELGHITLRAIGAAAAVRERCERLRGILAPWCLPAAGIAPSLVGELARRGQTLTLAESCTCGHAAAQIGAVPGASAVLRRAVVTYHNDAKAAMLGVDPRLIRRHGAVSEAVARAMATGARTAAGADLAVATTGIAGPGGGTPEKPVGTVWIAAADAGRVVARRILVQGTRERIQRRAAANALLLAWQLLRDGSPSTV